MTPILRRHGAAGLLVLLLLAVHAEPVAAHGIGSDASGKSAPEFLPLGVEHMLLGWDHLLFIVGVLLLAGSLGRAAKLISTFVAGHSLTLITATLGGWQVNAGIIDAVIGLSVCVVGVIGLAGRPTDWRWFYAVVFGFGLIHGLGLSTRLQDLGLPEDGLLHRVLFFNVGIELGQLLAIAVFAGIGRLATGVLRRASVQQGAFAALGATGMIAAATFAGLAAIDIAEGDHAEAVESSTGRCTVGDRTLRFTVGDGGHPPQKFYGPDQEIPTDDFGHVIGDGFVAVGYGTALNSAQVDELRTYIDQPRKVLAGFIDGQAEALRAVNAYEQLTCTAFDLAALDRFAKEWFADPRSRSAG